MHLELSDEQQLFTTSLREWLGERAGASAVRGWLDTGDLAAFERLFVGEGWAGVGFPEDLGGQGGGLLELALTARELGRAAAPSARWLQSAVVVPALADEPALVRAATESGEVTALAARADRIPAWVTSVQSRAGRLRGRIPCVLGAARSPRLLVPVADGGATSLWLVESADRGVGIHPRPLLDRSRDVADVVLDDVAARRLDVDANSVLGEIATRAAILVAADALGASERMLNWPSTTASSASSSGGRSARFRRSSTPRRRCWSPWNPRCPSSATRRSRPRKVCQSERPTRPWRRRRSPAAAPKSLTPH